MPCKRLGKSGWVWYGMIPPCSANRSSNDQNQSSRLQLHPSIPNFVNIFCCWSVFLPFPSSYIKQVSTISWCPQWLSPLIILYTIIQQLSKHPSGFIRSEMVPQNGHLQSFPWWKMNMIGHQAWAFICFLEICCFYGFSQHLFSTPMVITGHYFMIPSII